MLSLTSRPRRAPRVNVVSQNDEAVVLAVRGVRAKVELKGLALLVWNLCDGSNSFKQILALFQEAYPDNKDVEQDITQMMLELQDKKLLLLDGGDQALEYQGGVVRQIIPSVELQWHLEQIRQFIFGTLRIPELGVIEADVDALTGLDALTQAKQSDADAAPPVDSTVIPFNGALQSPSMKAVVDKAIAELKRLMPEVEAPMELSGNAIYLQGSHMGWHSNHTRSDGRVYCSWAEKKDSNFFRYEDPISGEIVTEWEVPGWNVKSFTIPPPNARFWHSIGANSLRLSIGFRYNLPDE